VKINLVNIENGLQGTGFRKFAGHVKSLCSTTEVFFVAPTHQFSLINRVLLHSNFGLSPEDINCIVDRISQADLIGVSFMSECRDIAATIINGVKARNPHSIVVSGGAHCRIYPREALNYSDIVCDGEGELAFEELLFRLNHSRDYFDIPGLHFRRRDEVIVNIPATPLSNSELELLPFLSCDATNQVYKPATKRFVNIDAFEYIKWLGLTLNIIWTRGCPNRCAYCYNSSYIDRHPHYARVRHPSPRYIVNEIKSVIGDYPMISWIAFIDDGMMALKKETLEEFGELYSREIGLPFLTYGTHPNYISEEKVRILVKAGTIFFRMGLQNCSERILGIYNRNTTWNRMRDSCQTIVKYRNYVTAPALDIILDNAFAGIDDRREHLRRVYSLPRPFVLNLHSLRIVPGSQLSRNINSLTGDEVLEGKDKNLLHIRATVYNQLHYLLSVFKPPRWLFELMIKHGCDDKREYPSLSIFARTLFLIRRATGNLLKLDFSFVSGKLAFLPYILLKLGFLGIYNRYSLHRRKRL